MKLLRTLSVTCALLLTGGLAQATVLTFYAGEGISYALSQDYGDNVTNKLDSIFSYEENGEGFTPHVTVEYIGVAGGTLGGDLSYYRDGFSGTIGVLNNEDDGEDYTTFKLIAEAGYSVVLQSLLWSGYGSDVVPVDSITVTDQGSNMLYNSGSFSATGTNGTINFGAITGQTLTVTADLTSAGDANDSFGFDNVTFSELELPTAPVIARQPVSVYTDPGDLVIFSAQATASSGTVSYAWAKNSVPLTDNEYIAGAASARLVISPVRLADIGNYQVVCTDAQGSTTSSVATLSFSLPLPSVASEPSDTTVASGANASFSVIASNAVSYQWHKGEDVITNETTATLQLNSVNQTNAGVYSVHLTNARGTVASKAARLSVTSTASLNEALDNNEILVDDSTGWSSQASITHDGVDAVQSADIGHGGSTQMDITLVGPGTYSFHWLPSSEYNFDYIRWLQDGTYLEARSGGSTTWEERSGFVADKAHTVAFRYTKDGGSDYGADAGFIDQFTFSPYDLSSVEEAIDAAPAALELGGAANWYGQTNDTYDGTDAARSPEIGHNETAWFETTVQGPGEVAFWSKTSTEDNHDHLQFRVDGSSAYANSGNSDWEETTRRIKWGTHTLRWAYEKDESSIGGEDAVWIDRVSYTPVERSSLQEAGDGAGLVWTTSGTNPWFGQDHFTDDGVDALQTGVTDHNGNTWIKAVTDEIGNFTFRWKVSSESNFDFLRFYVNGVQQAHISGNQNWTTYSVELTNSGPKELMWNYTKDVSGSAGDDAGWIDQVGFAVPTVGLSVASAYGSPVPAIGTQTYEVGSAVACSAADLTTPAATQYVCTGWTGTGAVPASGNTNAITVTLDETSSITWNWQKNIWLNVSIVGNGSLSHADGFYLADSVQNLVATPATGWLFMGWSGDASGTNNAAVTMDAPKAVLAVFSDDADGDGLTNTEEAGIGSNPWKRDTDDDGFDDAFEVAQSMSPTNDNSAIVNYIANNGSTFALYPSNVVLDVAVGQMVIETSGGTATLSLQLEESQDLVTWSNAGPAEVWSWPVDGEKNFFRVRSEE